MRRTLQICSEADYLRAHLTALEPVPREKQPALRVWKERMRLALKKWVENAGSHVTRSTGIVGNRNERGKDCLRLISARPIRVTAAG